MNGNPITTSATAVEDDLSTISSTHGNCMLRNLVNQNGMTNSSNEDDIYAEVRLFDHTRETTYRAERFLARQTDRLAGRDLQTVPSASLPRAPAPFAHQPIATQKQKKQTGQKKTNNDFLHHRGKHLSYQRSKHTLSPQTSLLKLEGVDDSKAASFYCGKKVAYVYRAKKEIQGSKIRVIWGKVTRPHGNSGVVRAQFRHNLPAKSFGASVRVMLYPSNI